MTVTPNSCVIQAYVYSVADKGWGVQAVAVVQRAMRQADPAEVMAELGFGQVDLVSSFAVSMSGVQCMSHLCPWGHVRIITIVVALFTLYYIDVYDATMLASWATCLKQYASLCLPAQLVMREVRLPKVKSGMNLHSKPKTNRPMKPHTM